MVVDLSVPGSGHDDELFIEQVGDGDRLLRGCGVTRREGDAQLLDGDGDVQIGGGLWRERGQDCVENTGFKALVENVCACYLDREAVLGLLVPELANPRRDRAGGYR
jgi:hypothetical protein